MPTIGEELVAYYLEQLEARRRGYIPCIAYKEDGTLCREHATILDRKRLGMVCYEHAPRQEEGV
jgi:hypothetical protein